MLSLAVHGGAGSFSPEALTPEHWALYDTGLRAALEAGFACLTAGQSALDAVEAAVRVLEDDPVFNAGRGAVFSHDGINELDAAIMDGATLAAGAVAAVRHIRHPVALARLVMERSPHVLLAGTGAEEFALENGMPLSASTWFQTEARLHQLMRARAGDRSTADTLDYFGTVGAVARDGSGSLAAATSTGGVTNKRFGRIGDSPIIGAGTYASNSSCAVTATGQGEYFLRATIARDVAARMEYLGESVAVAADKAIHERLARLGGQGGLIAMDRHGSVQFAFNTRAMFRGAIDSNGRFETALFAA